MLESLFPTVNLLRLLLCQWLQWLDLPDDFGQDLNMKNVKISMHIYDLYPPACRRLFWMFFSCTFSSATLRLMFLFDGVLVWLPASQPAAARIIPHISLISNTASSQPRSQPAATSQPYSQPRSQPAATSQPYSQPPNQQQQLSQPPSQPASHPESHPEPASLGIMMRLCARGEDSPLREGM